MSNKNPNPKLPKFKFRIKGPLDDYEFVEYETTSLVELKIVREEVWKLLFGTKPPIE